MDRNRLRMNPTKTEFIYFGSRQQLRKCTAKTININGEIITRAQKVRYLGVELDEQLSFSDHITAKCKTAMYGLQKIRNIRHLLTQDACHTLVLGTVISHLDYANAIFIGLPDTQIRKLQRVQNFAAKLVLQADKYSSSTTALKTLHWLPIRLRVQHKVLTLIWKCLNGLSPVYLRSLLTLAGERRVNMRSGDQHMRLQIPTVRRKTFANRSFNVQGSIWWNNVPNEIKQLENLGSFKTKLKTYLFAKF